MPCEHFMLKSAEVGIKKQEWHYEMWSTKLGSPSLSLY